VVPKRQFILVGSEGVGKVRVVLWEEGDEWVEIFVEYSTFASELWKGEGCQFFFSWQGRGGGWGNSRNAGERIDDCFSIKFDFKSIDGG